MDPNEIAETRQAKAIARVLSWYKNGEGETVSLSGSGGAISYLRDDGSTGLYLATNAHVIHKGDDSPSGELVDGEYYYTLRDSHGNEGFARLVTYNAEGVCGTDSKVDVRNTHYDSAILEVIDPKREPERHAYLWDKLQPLSFMQYSIMGRLDRINPLRFSLEPYPFNELVTTAQAYTAFPPERREGFIVGLPGDQDDYGLARVTYRFDEKTAVPYGRIDHLPGNLVVHPLEGDKLRGGYSGSFLIDEKTEKPIALFSYGDDEGRGGGTLLSVPLRAIAAIEQERANGRQLSVSETTSRCEVGEPRWHDDREELSGYRARLDASLAQFLAADKSTGPRYYKLPPTFSETHRAR